jgi:hypothetical protein
MNTRYAPKTAIRAVLVTLITAPILLWSFSGSALHSPDSSKASKANNASKSNVPNPKVTAGSALLSPFAMMPAGTKAAGNLDQVRNGPAASPTNPVDWVNGNAGAANAHYKEGQSIPYRLTLTNVPTGASNVNSVKIEWDILHSSKNAIDYITTVARTPPGGISETIHVCGDPQYSTVIPGCTEGSFTSFPIPAPIPTKSVGGNPQPQTSFNNLPSADKFFRIYNGTISNIQYIPNADGNLGDLTAAQSSTRISITFTATSPTVVLAWSGHIGSRNDWGFTAGVPNSAGGISGSPYHTRYIELCPAGSACGGGNQDRSLSAAAVEPPAACLISPDANSNCEGTIAHFTYGGTPDPSLAYSWGVTGNGTPNGSTTGSSFDVNVGAFANGATYTVSLSVTSAGGTTSCELPFTIKQNVAASNLANQSPCPGGTATFSTTASGTGPYTFAWTNGSTALSNGDRGGRVSISTVGNTSTLTITNVTSSDGIPADYNVTVGGSCGSPAVKTANLTVNANVGASALSPQTSCAGGNASFSTTASGSGVGTSSFTWKKGTTVLSSGINTVNNGDGTFTSTLSLTNVQAADADTYHVTVAGTCGNVTRDGSLTVNANTAISSGPSPAVACAGATSTTPTSFSVSATGTGTLVYAWKVNGVAAGSSSSSLTYDPSALAPGNYPVTVHVTSDCGSADANTTLNINSNPTVTIALTNACATSGTLTATPAGGSGSFPSNGYVWAGPGIVSGQGSNQITVNATGTYTVTVTDSSSCSGSVNGSLCFTLTSPAPIAAIQSQPSNSTAVAKANTGSSFLAKIFRIASTFAVPLI